MLFGEEGDPAAATGLLLPLLVLLLLLSIEGGFIEDPGEKADVEFGILALLVL